MDKSADAFRTISEVAGELDLPRHVLRSGRPAFLKSKPLKRAGGRRYYRPRDIEVQLARDRKFPLWARLYDQGRAACFEGAGCWRVRRRERCRERKPFRAFFFRRRENCRHSTSPLPRQGETALNSTVRSGGDGATGRIARQLGSRRFRRDIRPGSHVAFGLNVRRDRAVAGGLGTNWPRRAATSLMPRAAGGLGDARGAWPAIAETGVRSVLAIVCFVPMLRLKRAFSIRATVGV